MPAESSKKIGNAVAEELEHELAAMKNEWWCFLLLGIFLVICGGVALVFPFLSSVSVVLVLGAMLLVSGVVTIISAFWTGHWSAFLLQILVGVLYSVVGLLIVDKPIASTAALTLFLAGFAIIIGIFRVVAALTIRFPQWGWALLNGAVTTMFGLLVYRMFPEDPSGVLWIIGFLVGFELLLNGWTWIMLAVGLHNLPDEK